MAKSKQIIQPQASTSKSAASNSSTKSKGKPAAAAASTSASIDDIFAKPSAGKQATPAAAAVSASKAAGKVKASPAESASTFAPKSKKKTAAASGEKIRAVETVLDPSAVAAAPAVVAVDVKGKMKKRDRAELDDEEAFRDSRGEGPRRRTEEGYAIFKEAELKIDPTAGGTPLCPFDCDCCF